MEVNLEVLESELTEVEMALLIATNVAMNAALTAGANAQIMVQHLDQHENNFSTLGKYKAQHVMAALQMLVKNTAGMK